MAQPVAVALMAMSVPTVTKRVADRLLAAVVAPDLMVAPVETRGGRDSAVSGGGGGNGDPGTAPLGGTVDGGDGGAGGVTQNFSRSWWHRGR